MTDRFVAVHQNIYREVEGEKRSMNPDGLVRVRKRIFSSFRRKPESSTFMQLQASWTPVFTEVTTFCRENPLVGAGFIRLGGLIPARCGRT